MPPLRPASYCIGHCVGHCFSQATARAPRFGEQAGLCRCRRVNSAGRPLPGWTSDARRLCFLSLAIPHQRSLWRASRSSHHESEKIAASSDSRYVTHGNHPTSMDDLSAPLVRTGEKRPRTQIVITVGYATRTLAQASSYDFDQVSSLPFMLFGCLHDKGDRSIVVGTIVPSRLGTFVTSVSGEFSENVLHGPDVAG